MRMTAGAGIWLCGAALAPLAWLLGGSPRATVNAATQITQRTHVLIVSGVGGDSARTERFTRLALEASAALRTRYNVEDSLITVLAERTAHDPRIIRERSTRDAVRGALARLAATAQPNERVILIYIGHGSAQSGRPQLALVGPDLGAAELATLLAGIKATTLAVVLAASASGDFVKPLAAPGRVIITATKSGAEQNESLFAEHFVSALGTDAADSDKDHRVSLLELFTYTRREVARVYETSNRLLTEHAVLEDDGDGIARPDASATGADGPFASRVAINRIGTVAATNDARAVPFVRKREDLQRQIDSLRTRRDRLSSAEYDRRLEDLVVQLAQVNRALRDTLGMPRKP
ncbi:MAG: hypothetical protein ACT4P6_16290 [Gemmatimonadaceae bacterium]